MITGALAAESSRIFEHLETRSKRLGEERVRYLAQALGNSEHRWRSAAALWPDLGLE